MLAIGLYRQPREVETSVERKDGLLAPAEIWLRGGVFGTDVHRETVEREIERGLVDEAEQCGAAESREPRAQWYCVAATVVSLFEGEGGADAAGGDIGAGIVVAATNGAGPNR